MSTASPRISEVGRSKSSKELIKLWEKKGEEAAAAATTTPTRNKSAPSLPELEKMHSREDIFQKDGADANGADENGVELDGADIIVPQPPVDAAQIEIQNKHAVETAESSSTVSLEATTKLEDGNVKEDEEQPKHVENISPNLSNEEDDDVAQESAATPDLHQETPAASPDQHEYVPIMPDIVPEHIPMSPDMTSYHHTPMSPDLSFESPMATRVANANANDDDDVPALSPLSPNVVTVTFAEQPTVRLLDDSAEESLSSSVDNMSITPDPPSPLMAAIEAESDSAFSSPPALSASSSSVSPSSSPKMRIATKDALVSEADEGWRPMTADEFKNYLLEQKQQAIKRLEFLGYDPLKGVYTAHRKELMREKTKVIDRLETLGYDPYKGMYAAHRGKLMEEKNKAIGRLNSLGIHPYKGMYVAHRGRLMEEKNKAISRLNSLGIHPLSGLKVGGNL